MKKIITELQEHPQAWPFLVPVAGVPDYYNVIKEPMGIHSCVFFLKIVDLKTLDENLEEDKYKTIEGFEKDVHLIFSNCKSYNEDGTTYVKW